MPDGVYRWSDWCGSPRPGIFGRFRRSGGLGQYERVKDGPPDDDAYERVTNPERFAPLHEAADALVARLESQYQVERTDGGPAAYEGVIRQVGLVPTVGAPLIIRWDDFPAVSVRYGSRHEESYPQCGCDACERHEQPDELIEDLERKIEAVVAGRFSESVVTDAGATGLNDADGPWLRFEFNFGDGRASGGTRLHEGDPLRNESGEVVWPPWPSRNPTADA
jgi:uncharacterized protein DUF6226